MCDLYDVIDTYVVVRKGVMGDAKLFFSLSQGGFVEEVCRFYIRGWAGLIS